jgi:hypothetical protein
MPIITLSSVYGLNNFRFRGRLFWICLSLFCYFYLLVFSPNIKTLTFITIIVTIMVTAKVHSNFLNSCNGNDIKVVIRNIIFFISLFILLQHFIIKDYLMYSGFPSTTGFDTEPSHFILATGPFLLFLFLVGDFLEKAAVLALVFVITVFIGSLISGLFLIILGSIYFVSSSKNLAKLFWLPVCSFIFFIVFFYYGTDHIYQRIFLSDSNISSLVYLQGWEELVGTIQQGKYFGLGLNNSENTGLGKNAEMIYQIYGNYKQLQDLGFLAADLIVELGILGVLIVFFVSYMVANSFIGMISLIRKNHDKTFNYVLILGHCMVLFMFFDLYIRSAGYLSPGVYFFFLGLSILKYQNARKQLTGFKN